MYSLFSLSYKKHTLFFMLLSKKVTLIAAFYRPLPASRGKGMTQIFTHKDINKAAQQITIGKVVAFPTETVYGLGANALDKNAVQKIFMAKGRPSDNPLILHIARKNDIFKWSCPDADIKMKVRLLIQEFWPGPLTLILPKTPDIPDVVSAGLETVGVRMPANRLAQKLIKAAGVPLAAPSANLSGKPSSTRFEHVWDDFNGKIAGIVKSSPSKIGLESTVVDLTVSPPVILRPGSILQEELQKILPDITTVNKEGKIAKSPGMKYKHYAPEALVYLFENENLARWNDILMRCKSKGKKTRILSPNLQNNFSKKMYELLRKADKDRVDVILIKPFDRSGIGQTIWNRLKKSATEIIS